MDGARVIVAGTHVSFYDQILQQAQTNAVFLLNVADVLTRGGDFVSLRTKQQSVAVLRDNITNAQVRWTQFLVVGGMPIAVIGFGLLWFSLGRAKRAGYRATYGPSAAVGTDD